MSVFGLLSDTFIILRCAEVFQSTSARHVTFSRVYAITSKSKMITAYMTTLACAKLVSGLMIFHHITDISGAAAQWMVAPYLCSKTKLLTHGFPRFISGKRLFFFPWAPCSVRGFRWLQENTNHSRYVNRDNRVRHRGLVHMSSMEHAQDFRSSSCDRGPVRCVLPRHPHHAYIFSTPTAVAS